MQIMENSPIISLKNISMSFDGENVLQDLNLNIRDGEFVTLLGPSGCGKTTTLRIIGGFIKPDAGDVFFSGKRINDLPPHKRAVNTIFQKYALFPHLNVYDNVAFGMRVHGKKESEVKKTVKEMLELVNLSGFSHRGIHQLSGGQQQRVAIARALANDPKILLLDEPLGALDLKLRKDMQIELKRIQQSLDITFIYVTHDQEEALTMSDRIAVMNAGVIEQLGTPMEIYDHPLTRFVAGFIGESNIFDGTVTAVEGDLLRVDTPAGKLLTRGSGFAVGEEMHVSIRPEYLEAGERNADGFDLPARIKDFTYMGTVVKTALDMADGTELKLSRFEQDANAHEGDKVYLSWRPEKSVPIKKSHT